MIPFDYPAIPHSRRHGPTGYLDVASYRPWLRDEFGFRCVYCLRREVWEPDTSVFEVEHFHPVSTHPELATVYDNLLYSCSACNSAKGAGLVPDPCVAMTSDAVQVHADGRLEPLTPTARRLVRQLDLNDPQYVAWRRRMIRIVALAAVHDPELHRSLLDLPAELPDLALLKPSGNTRPSGVEQSFLRRRHPVAHAPGFFST